MQLKGQLWYLDILFAVTIFSAALLFFFKSDLDFLQNSEEILEDMDREARLVTDNLLSSGFPEMWDTSDVMEIGITDNHRINETKLKYLGSLGYNVTKTKFRIKYEYYLFFEDRNGVEWINATHEGLGKRNINSSNVTESDPNNLIKITRFVIYKSNPKRMVLYLWQ